MSLCEKYKGSIKFKPTFIFVKVILKEPIACNKRFELCQTFLKSS